MSVTFSVYADSKFVAPDGWVAEYEEDEMFGKIQTNQNPLEMNVANGNFCRLMELLDLEIGEDGYCGTWGDGSLQVVKGKIVFTLDSFRAMPELDGGKVDVVHNEPGKALMVECGVGAGYFQERLQTLLEIVNKAIEVGGVVTFG
jgi:hypothetical protein